MTTAVATTGTATTRNTGSNQQQQQWALRGGCVKGYGFETEKRPLVRLYIYIPSFYNTKKSFRLPTTCLTTHLDHGHKHRINRRNHNHNQNQTTAPGSSNSNRSTRNTSNQSR